MAERFFQFSKRIKTRTHLPTPPQILSRLIEVCGDEAGESENLSQIILSDPSLSAKIMNMVCSAPDGVFNSLTTIDQAVRILGNNAVKTIAVSAVDIPALCQATENFIGGLKVFWRHSLMCAVVSLRIAEKIPYAHPDEAYLTGLLHDIGKLILWAKWSQEHPDMTPSPYAQDLTKAAETHYKLNHCDLGAWFIRRWSLPSFMADAVLYHHEPLNRIRDALPLVKITYAANALCSQPSSGQAAALEAAKNILGLEISMLEEILRQAEEKVGKTARDFGIDIKPIEGSSPAISERERQKQQDLLKQVRNITLVQSTLQNLLDARNEDSILNALRQDLNILFDVKAVFFFMYEPERNILFGKNVSPDNRYDLINSVAIPFQAEKSILVKSLLQGNPLDSFNDSIKSNPTIIDEQIIRLIEEDGILCLPMAADQRYIGVIVLGLRANRLSGLAEEIELLVLFARQAAAALHANSLRPGRGHRQQPGLTPTTANGVRRVAHEVNTPLSIIKNYLAVLKSKLAENRSCDEDIRIINEEVDSVALILRELSDSAPPATIPGDPLDLNALLTDLIKTLRTSHLLRPDINTQMKLDPSLPSVRIDKNRIKQAFNNLIINAAEAMPHGGNLEVQTRHVTDAPDARLDPAADHVVGQAEITFRDDGPGIVDTVKSKLFEPYVTTKEQGHAGLGLSIARSYVMELNGTLTCQSEDSKGTCFKLVFPITHSQLS